MSDFDWAEGLDKWDEALEAAAEVGSLEIAISDDPELEKKVVIAVAEALRSYVVQLSDAGYAALPGAAVLEFLAAVALTLYRAAGVDNVT